MICRTKILIKQMFIIFIVSLFYTNILHACEEKNDNSNLEKGNELKEIVLANVDSVQTGQNKFGALCAYCHGDAGSGGKARKLQGRTMKADYLFKTITNGKKRGAFNMPPWKNLPEKTRWQLVAYILSLSELDK